MYSRLTHFFRYFLPQLSWEISTREKIIYLTFDDGPHPDITPKVIEILDQYNAKATFFCVGENVRKYPDTYEKVIIKGHQTGNHTFNHLNGWKTSSKEYYHNIEKCAELVNSSLFRPPYGKIKPAHIPYLKMQYRIIMWSVLTEDYDNKISPEKCLDKSKRHTGPGSIVVFHDSLKASKNMLYALPRFLAHFSEQGFRFHTLKA